MGGGPPVFLQGSTCLVVLWIPPDFTWHKYGTFTLCRWLSQNHSSCLISSLCGPKPRNARITVWALSISLAATLEIDFSFSSSGYLDVSVHRVPSVYLCIQYTVAWLFHAGFPHSEIRTSMDICSYMRLFAAYHVFHRLSVPRHPPCALFCLTSIRLPSVVGFLSDLLLLLTLSSMSS